MVEKTGFCVVDAGNTQVKIIDFENDDIVSFRRLYLDNRQALAQELKDKKNKKSILSSVLNVSDRQYLASLLEPDVMLDATTHLPISLSGYDTPHTLGADRIANAVAAHHYASTKNALVIDIGTCIKFDLVVDGVYQGGSISPGYDMRLKAMHSFTGALPLLTLEDSCAIVGKTTKGSMLSGVLHGVQKEIEGFLEEYSKEFRPLTIFLTGGDYKKFDIEYKNSIFADENLTVKGLYLILKHNV